MKNNVFLEIYSIFKSKRKNKLAYAFMKTEKELNGYIDYYKIKLAKNIKTPISKLDELLLEDVSDIRVEIYKRNDFEDIKPMLKHLDEKEYEFYQVAINESLKIERLAFDVLKFFVISIIVVFFTRIFFLN